MIPSGERKIVKLCHNHISGVLGEKLFKFLLENKWIEKGKNQVEYEITDIGWDELEIIGIDVQQLQSAKRKKIVSCNESYHGILHEHAGAHLGSLLANWLFERRWIVQSKEKQLTVTKEGLYGLESLGVDINNIREYP